MWDEKRLIWVILGTILKSYSHISNRMVKFVKLEDFAKKTKMSKFGSKNVLLGHFWARILQSYCHILNR